MLQNPISNILNTGVSSKVVYVGKACDSYPCWNNGICLPTDTINGYTCVCNEFYNGVHCENKIIKSKINDCVGYKDRADCVWRHLFDKALNSDNVKICKINPCLNGGKCITLNNNQTQCLCSVKFIGGLCEEAIPIFTSAMSEDNWNSLKIFIALSVIFVLVLSILVFCYSGSYSCYLFMPSTNYRYRRWEIPVDVSEGIVDKSDDEIDDIRLIEMEKKMKRRMGDCDETSEESNELDRCSSFCTSKQPRVNEGPKSRNEEFEMKLKSLRLSRTQDTLVSYEALNVNEEDEYGSD